MPEALIPEVLEVLEIMMSQPADKLLPEMQIQGFIVDRPEILNQPVLTPIFITGAQIQDLLITEVELPEATIHTTGLLILPREVVAQLEALLLQHEAPEQQEVQEALVEAVVVEDNFQNLK